MPVAKHCLKQNFCSQLALFRTCILCCNATGTILDGTKIMLDLTNLLVHAATCPVPFFIPRMVEEPT